MPVRAQCQSITPTPPSLPQSSPDPWPKQDLPQKLDAAPHPPAKQDVAHVPNRGLYPGARVRIHSLNQLRDLNEQVGQVLAFDKEKDRWKVKLLELQQIKLFREGNLEAIDVPFPPSVPQC